MAISAQGSTFQVDILAVATTVADVVSFSGFDGEASEIDQTTLASTAKEKQLGLKDNGSFSLELFWNQADAAQDELRLAQTDGAIRDFTLNLPGAGGTASFQGYVKSFNLSGGVDDNLKSTCNITISGDVTWS